MTKRLSSHASTAADRQRGLTLAEVLVALAIVGLVAAAVVALIGQNARFAADAEERVLAGILADNMMVEALARSTPLERGASESERPLGVRTFAGRLIVTEAEGGLVQIRVEVRSKDTGQSLATATTLKRERQ